MLTIPSREELKIIRKSMGLTEAAKQLGVSRSTIDRWCANYSLNHHECKNNCTEEMPSQLTREQQDVVYGCLLGDGGIFDGLFEMRQSIEKEDFLKTIKQILGPLFSKMDYGQSRKPSRIGGIVSHALVDWKGGYSHWCRLRSRKNNIFHEIRELFYRDKEKIVPEHLLLNWKMVAYWYCCDGTNDIKGKRAIFCTDSFTKQDIELLIAKMSRLGLECTFVPSKKRIAISSKQYDFFQQNIEQHIVHWNCFQHKMRQQGNL